jgi:hypothetical protein
VEVVRIFAIGFVALICGCESDPPHEKIDHAYFECAASRSLEGGIYGKGMVKRFGPHPAACESSDWVRITRSQFKDLATAWYGEDWEKESPWWRRSDGDEVVPQ